ncbi:hypothetical protein GA0070613_3080 [Micromonospora inositola]|uniref:Uncharacterized protein n=1 Tax=Micromonospora inositola TaxID=47865 RepID=A0A1C5IMR5_9ACTN|nr:hypothetical protein GA0070613_3080 [Micromonospora inositola]
MEARHLFLGTVSAALGHYRQFLAQPGRWRYVPNNDCACCDIRESRDTLEEALRALPPPARAELGRMVAALDAEFLRRTLPDPWFPRISPWHASRPWWWHRLPHG